MRRIQLTQNKQTFVDDGDCPLLSEYKWCAHRTGKKVGHTFYAERGFRINGRHHIVLMHRLILGLRAGDHRETDHIDGNGLNNQRINLRICSRSENNQNRRVLKGSSSQYRGVSWDGDRKKWRASIKWRGKQSYLGLFVLEVEAALAYNRAAREHYGEYARLNDVEEKGDC